MRKRILYKTVPQVGVKLVTANAWLRGVGFESHEEALRHAVAFNATGGGEDYLAVARHLEAILREAKKAKLI